jgi:hypothetical protein
MITFTLITPLAMPTSYPRLLRALRFHRNMGPDEQRQKSPVRYATQYLARRT